VAFGELQAVAAGRKVTRLSVSRQLFPPHQQRRFVWPAIVRASRIQWNGLQNAEMLMGTTWCRRSPQNQMPPNAAQ